MISFDKLKSCRIGATDGEIGTVESLYFDDATWEVRYVVADTKRWLPGRRVLLSPHSLRAVDQEKEVLPTSLTKQQVQDSPDIAVDRPVERQHQIALHMYYGWPLYWGGASLSSARTLGLYPERTATGERENEPPMWEAVQQEEEKGDPHLRDAKAIEGYRIEAEDGEFGKVKDFLIDDREWQVRYLVVSTGGWLTGHDVLIAPAWIRRIEWSDEHVYVDLRKQTIESSPIYDASLPLGRDYEELLYKHYAREKYWQPGQDVYTPDR